MIFWNFDLTITMQTSSSVISKTCRILLPMIFSVVLTESKEWKKGAWCQSLNHSTHIYSVREYRRGTVTWIRISAHVQYKHVPTLYIAVKKLQSTFSLLGAWPTPAYIYTLHIIYVNIYIFTCNLYVITGFTILRNLVI